MLRAAIESGIKPDDLAAHLGKSVASWLILVRFHGSKYTAFRPKLKNRHGSLCRRLPILHNCAYRHTVVCGRELLLHARVDFCGVRGFDLDDLDAR